MPDIVADHTIGHLSAEEILRRALAVYAEPAYWLPHEIDTGAGFAEVRPWIHRDQGRHARQVLEYLEKRETPASGREAGATQ